MGPFVPAPPEVAMQMLRDQGGPSPYDGGGRKMRSGPHIGGPAPIIAVPPAFRQDPRKMRRYIPYRSFVVTFRHCPLVEMSVFYFLFFG